MFQRHRNNVVGSEVRSQRVRRIVRLLQNDEELQAAVERARAFERRGVDRGQQRVVNYDRYVREGRANLPTWSRWIHPGRLNSLPNLASMRPGHAVKVKYQVLSFRSPLLFAMMAVSKVSRRTST